MTRNIIIRGSDLTTNKSKIEDWIKMESDGFFQSFIDSIKERISGPVYGSFIISWLIWNWKIWYITFFVDQNLLGGFTKIHYIEEHYASVWTLLVYPLLSTFFIVYVMPHVNDWAIGIYEEHNSKRIRKRFKISKEEPVSSEKYFELFSKYQEEKKNYTSVFDETKSLKAEIATLKSDLETSNQLIDRIRKEESETQKENHSVRNKYNELLTRKSLGECFKGNWRNEYNIPRAGTGQEEFFIKEDKYYLTRNPSAPEFRLELIDVDKRNQTIKFIKVGARSNDKRRVYNELKIINNDRYEGFENGENKITYTRIQ